MSTDIKKYFKELSSSGWQIVKSKKSYKLRSPKGILVVCSLTPSCPFALKHIKGDVKRALKKETIVC